MSARASRRSIVLKATIRRTAFNGVFGSFYNCRFVVDTPRKRVSHEQIQRLKTKARNKRRKWQHL